MRPTAPTGWQVLGWLKPYLWTYRKKVAGVLAAAIVMSFASVVEFYLLRYFIDSVLARGGTGMGSLGKVFLIYASSILFRGVGEYINVQQSASLRVSVTARIKRDLFEKYQSLPIERLDRHSFGDLMTFADTSYMSSGLNSLFLLVKDLATALALAVTAFTMNGTYTVYCLLIVPVSSYLSSLIYRRIHSLAKKQQAAEGESREIIYESLVNARTIRIFTGEKREMARFGRVQEGATHLALQIAQSGNLVSTSYTILTLTGTGIVFLLFCRDVAAGLATVGSFVAFITAVVAMYSPICRMFQYWSRLLELHGGAEEAFKLLHFRTETPEGTLAPAASPRILEFRDVSFRYPGSDKDVITNACLSVRRGEVLSILGGNGQGKTTMLNLIARIHDPSSGRIILDGTDVRELSIQGLRKLISMVSQDTILFSESLRYNICYGKPDATDEEIVAAALKANAHEFIEKLPNGYETVIGEGGGHLSVGQRQKIAIARAFLKDSPIIMLDEPTSSLDESSRQAVVLGLKRLMEDRIVLLVTHQMEILPAHSRVVRIENGRIREVDASRDGSVAGSTSKRA